MAGVVLCAPYLCLSIVSRIRRESVNGGALYGEILIKHHKLSGRNTGIDTHHTEITRERDGNNDAGGDNQMITVEGKHKREDTRKMQQ